eukprot:Protomagalhaensia_sp_Gyna_25__2085@NODE_2121_length_1278_cov_186_121872_g1754_i0_p4_GENE_NODE_2121_length_1278_cov_186_121872_g1754_i0NODE_2121_length_1278_cov_186_121872_g1754_i0_p4_ORF_typecomplete_len103_score26_51Robl_LC7/PF03259_17/3_2e13MAPKK1_Int/PF08923_10/0_02DUF272/PF03312_15/0_032_NODE_2121_length_1278_cov_186_121872_g1754_i044352
MQKETLDRITRLKRQPGVQGVVVATRSGRPIHSTMPPSETKSAAVVAAKCFGEVQESMGKLDGEDRVTLVRVKTQRKSYILSEESDYVLILICEDQQQNAPK